MQQRDRRDDHDQHEHDDDSGQHDHHYARAYDDDIEVVGEAADGAEALELCRELTPDVLLLDLSMPRVDGLEVIRTLRDEAPSIKIIVASGFAAARLAPLALELGAVAYFEKGGSATELQQLVRETCPAHRFGD